MKKFNPALILGDEKILYLRIKNKDKEAFIKAYDAYIDQIYRFVFFKVGSKEEAEDLTSAIFLKAWDYIKSGNKIEFKTVKSFLYKIARNTIIDHYRKKSGQELVYLGGAENNFNIIDEKSDLSEKAAIASDLRDIEKKLVQLKDEYREVLLMRFIDELTIREIAEALDKSKGNVRVLIFRAVEALKKLV